MGVTLDLRLVDHDVVVTRGLPAVNEAIAKQSPEVLAEYLRRIPFAPNEAVIQWRKERCEQLRKVKAPQVIIDNETRFLRLVTGEAYTQANLEKLSLAELRNLLGTWGWAQHTYSLDKSWNALEWFLQPTDDPQEIRPGAGEPAQSLADKAVHGSELSPLDVEGQPVIRTCGSQEAGCFGYNPPPSIAAIQQWLAAVDGSSWKKLLSRRERFIRRTSPALDEMAEEVAADELEVACSALLKLKLAYQVAAERGRGVACEFSL